MLESSIRLDSACLSRLISGGYTAPLTSAAWQQFAEEAALALGSQLALIEYHDEAEPGRSFVAAGGLAGFDDVYTLDRPRNEDDNYWIGIRDKKAGTVRLGREMVSPEAMRQSKIYSRLAMPWHLEHFLIGAITTGDGVRAFFSLGRTEREVPFTQGDKRLVSTILLPHLRRSMSLHRDVAAIRGANALLSAALDQAPWGVVVFDSRAQPVVINRPAEDIFSVGDGLTLQHGALLATDPVAQAALDRALSAGLQIALGRLVPLPDSVWVPRRSGLPPFQVVLSPVNSPEDGTGFPRGSAVIATIRSEQPGTRPDVPVALRATYALTRAESRLCQALLEGRSLAEAAIALHISRNTAKTHLTRIFDKTGVRSQVALLRLLALGSRK